MWKRIGEIPLRNGEMMKIRMVKAPDAHHRDSIMSFFAHLKGIWLWHLNMTLGGELNELKCRFYLGFVNGRIISNVSTWEYGPIGIVGHLYTVEDCRRKGACIGLMKAQIQDFLGRGGKILIGGFKPSSYPIAKNLGFQSIINSSEVMRYDVCADFEKEYFQAKTTFCRDAMWKDWPGISLLFTVKGGWNLRSVKHKIFGPFDYEDYFLEDMRERLKGLCMSKVLVTEKRNIVGHTTLALKRRSSGKYWLLDFFVHPAIISHVNTKLDAMRWPKGKIRCYVEASCHEKHDVLLAQGFEEKAVLQRQVGGKKLKMIVMQLETKSN